MSRSHLSPLDHCQTSERGDWSFLIHRRSLGLSRTTLWNDFCVLTLVWPSYASRKWSCRFHCEQNETNGSSWLSAGWPLNLPSSAAGVCHVTEDPPCGLPLEAVLPDICKGPSWTEAIRLRHVPAPQVHVEAFDSSLTTSVKYLLILTQKGDLVLTELVHRAWLRESIQWKTPHFCVLSFMLTATKQKFSSFFPPPPPSFFLEGWEPLLFF